MHFHVIACVEADLIVPKTTSEKDLELLETPSQLNQYLLPSCGEERSLQKEPLLFLYSVLAVYATSDVKCLR